MGENQDLSTLFDEARFLNETEILEIKRGNDAEVQILALPRDITLASTKKFLDEYRERPERRQGTAEVTTLQSFVDHANRFKDADSALFAHDDPEKPALLAVLDYHERCNDVGIPAEGATEDREPAPRFGAHRTLYRFPVSEEWAAWTGIGGAEMTQRDFAEFLEDRVIDVLDPSSVGETTRAAADKLGVHLAGPARLMELARGLSIHVDAKVTPNGFVIAIPIFRGGAPYQIAVRLRYRVRSGAVSWWVALHRADASFRDAFEEACGVASEKTDLPLFYGQPER